MLDGLSDLDRYELTVHAYLRTHTYIHACLHILHVHFVQKQAAHPPPSPSLRTLILWRLEPSAAAQGCTVLLSRTVHLILSDLKPETHPPLCDTLRHPETRTPNTCDCADSAGAAPHPH